MFTVWQNAKEESVRDQTDIHVFPDLPVGGEYVPGVNYIGCLIRIYLYYDLLYFVFIKVNATYLL